MPQASKPKRARHRKNAPNSAIEQLRAELLRAGKTLHDDVGPLLAAAGLRLQLLRMDHPQTAERLDEVLATLEQAMERVRALSQTLSPSPFAASAPAAPAVPAAPPRRVKSR